MYSKLSKKKSTSDTHIRVSLKTLHWLRKTFPTRLLTVWFYLNENSWTSQPPIPPPPLLLNKTKALRELTVKGHQLASCLGWHFLAQRLWAVQVCAFVEVSYIVFRTIVYSDYSLLDYDYHSNGRKWKGKSLLMRVKEETERASLKLNIKKTKTMASSPITSCK